MKVVTAQCGLPRSLPRGLCPLIESVGTPDFPRQLLASVEDMLDAPAAAVYALTGSRGTRLVIGDWQAGGKALARHTGLYAGRYAGDDPARRLARRGEIVTTVLRREELPNAGHRALLEEAGFAFRVATLVPAGPSSWYSLNVLRPAGRGLSDAVLQRYVRTTPVLGSLITRHLRRESAEARLTALCPSLARREAEVCGALLRGRDA